MDTKQEEVKTGTQKKPSPRLGTRRLVQLYAALLNDRLRIRIFP